MRVVAGDCSPENSLKNAGRMSAASPARNSERLSVVLFFHVPLIH